MSTKPVLAACLLGAAAAACAAWTGDVRAHDAPTGWSYPQACCSDFDCREVADAAIGEGADGYTIQATGELLGFGDARLKDSPDGRFHWCSAAGAPKGRTICLFVPPRGF